MDKLADAKWEFDTILADLAVYCCHRRTGHKHVEEQDVTEAKQIVFGVLREKIHSSHFEQIDGL